MLSLQKGLISLAIAFTATAASAHYGRHHGHHHYNYGVDQKVCATIYSDYKGAMNVSASTQISDLANMGWDNQIDDITVQPGCAVTVYQFKNFNVNLYNGRPMYGFKSTYTGQGRFADTVAFQGYKADKISSLSCSCK